MDTQNDAIFEAGATFFQNHHSWYQFVRFRGGVPLWNSWNPEEPEARSLECRRMSQGLQPTRSSSLGAVPGCCEQQISFFKDTPPATMIRLSKFWGKTLERNSRGFTFFFLKNMGKHNGNFSFFFSSPEDFGKHKAAELKLPALVAKFIARV